MNKCYCSKPLGYTCHVCRKPEPWEDNKGIVTFIKWYFGKREQWSIHDFTRANLMGNKILDLLADQNTANAERIRGHCDKILHDGQSEIDFVHDSPEVILVKTAINISINGMRSSLAAARLIETPLTGKE